MEKIKVTLEIPEPLVKHCQKLGITKKKNIKELFLFYIQDTLGSPYGMDLDYFITWTDEPDNIVDFLD